MKRIKWVLIISSSIIIIGIVAVVIYTVTGPRNYERLKVGLELGRLSKLPAAASEINVSGTENFFSETVYIKFKAPEKDIESFIHSSQGLQNAKAEDFSYDEWKSENSYIVEKYSWFNPATDNGRIYEIPQDENADYGTVIIDDSTGTVYIKTSHS